MADGNKVTCVKGVIASDSQPPGSITAVGVITHSCDPPHRLSGSFRITVPQRNDVVIAAPWLLLVMNSMRGCIRRRCVVCGRTAALTRALRTNMQEEATGNDSASALSPNTPDRTTAPPPTRDRRHAHYDPGYDASIPLVPSLWWIAGMAALSFVVVASVALLAQLLAYRANALGTVLVPGLVAALLVFHITNGIRNRRKATARRLHAVCELNHHVRNGLQQIAAVTTVHSSGGCEEIQNAIDRIERILRDTTTEIRSED
jgi:hypothetical protein